MVKERIVSVDDICGEPVEIVKVPVNDRGGVMFIGSLTGEEFVEWIALRDSADGEDKKNASARLIARSLVKGPDVNADGSLLDAAQRKAAEARIGTDDMIPKFRKTKMLATERLLRAIFKLNGINQKGAEAAAKND